MRKLKTEKQRFTLTLKMNIMLVGTILLLSVGLLFISYRIYCQRVDTLYNERMEDALQADQMRVLPIFTAYFWQMLDTDEFREVRSRALEANDPSIIADWMHSKPSVTSISPNNNTKTETGGMEAVSPDYLALYEAMNYLEAVYMPENVFRESEEGTIPSLYMDYDTVYTLLGLVKDTYRVESLYVQFERDGVTYNIADPDEGLLYIGSVEPPLKEFAAYGDNKEIPATTYHMGRDWLRTTGKPLVTQGGREGGVLAVDIDMNDIVRERHRFLNKSISFVIVITAAAICISMFLMHRIATRPLRKLAEAATTFGKGGRGYTKEDVLDLDIQSKDEIGDLYREIHSMQSRIVDYTDNIAHITAERERARSEMRMAESIQIAMLPESSSAFPDHPEFNLCARMDPAREVGGDFYDFFLIDNKHLALLIADVSDKGLPAALFMMAAKILLNYRAMKGGTPSEILSDVNRHICRFGQTEMFVTVWLGILDLSNGSLTCSNAGHEFPALRGQDGVFHLIHDKHDFVVGGMERTCYHDYELELKPGDAIFIYTDGVTDANNAANEFYGTERMIADLNRYAKESPKGILDGLKASIEAFVGDAPQFDDLTMLCLEYRGKKDTDSF